MPSPFPGMNPYLEHPDDWQSFHNHFVTRSLEVLTAQVRDRYLVKMNEQVFIHELPADKWRSVGRPDIAVLNGGRRKRAGKGTAVREAPAAVTLAAAVDEIKVLGLEIRSLKDRSLVTALEFLSPTNKGAAADRELYAAKRLRLLTSDAHFVEIDLLRGGTRPRLGDPLPPCDYYALVSRVERRPVAGFWPIALRERLPVIPIPLRRGDADVSLDLQTVLHGVYDSGTYAREIYLAPPDPPLSKADAKWAAQFVPPRS